MENPFEWTGKLIAILSALLALAGALIKLMRGSVELYSEHLAKRKLNRIKELSPYAEAGSVNRVFLQTAMSAEMFRMIANLDTSPVKAQAMMAIFNRGDMSLKHLRSVAHLVRVCDEGNVKININFIDRIAARISLLLALTVISTAGLYTILLALSGKPLYIATGFAILAAGYITATWIIGEFIALKRASKLKERLNSAPLNIPSSPL